jgi:hypothetical protein
MLSDKMTKCYWCNKPFIKGDKLIIEMTTEIEYKDDANIESPLNGLEAKAYHNGATKGTCCHAERKYYTQQRW